MTSSWPHDPQPLAIRQFHSGGDARWIWRCHIDTSEPFPETWAFLQPYLHGYNAAVFTMADFVPHGFPIGRVEIIPPAIAYRCSCHGWSRHHPAGRGPSTWSTPSSTGTRLHRRRRRSRVHWLVQEHRLAAHVLHAR
jgi:hypothetical protein